VKSTEERDALRRKLVAIVALEIEIELVEAEIEALEKDLMESEPHEQRLRCV
jgi:hypothetical protein